MASNAIVAANVAPYIPEMWSLIVKAAYEANLVIASHCDRKYEKELKYGDTLNVPNLSNFTGAQTVDYNTDLTLVETVQNTDQIIINYHYYQAIGLGEAEQIQDRPDFLKAAMGKCGYDIAKIMDDTIADLVNSLTTNTVGTEGTALSVDAIIAAYEGLNEQDVPENDRVWVVDPESVTDLLKLDYFVRMDYIPDSVVSKGFQGRQIFGSPVYMTTNLNVINSSYHAAIYFQKDWVAVISQEAPTPFMFEWPQKFSKVIGVKDLWGIKQMREPAACWIKTRS